MNVQRSPPTGSGTSGRSDSQPNLTNLNLYETDFLRGVNRYKRKHPDEDHQIKSELIEIRRQMQDIMSFLSDFSTTQKENNGKLCQDLASIKEQVTIIKTTTENLVLEQNKIKVELANVVESSKVTDKKIESLEYDVQQIKSASQTSSQAAASPSIQKYEDIVSELQDRNFRDKNVILTSIPEPELSDLNERRDFDRSEVLKILRAIYKDCPEPVKISRLGKYESGKSRPIKACFGSQETAKLILRNKNKENCGVVRIYSDQTKYQQIFMKNLKEELQHRTQNGETNLTIKYIKGTPRIISQQPKKLILQNTQ